jgi:hypothetical protein
VARRPDVTRLALLAPPWVQPLARRVVTNPTLNRSLRRPRWGNLRRDRPFSRRAGDRGTSVERYYSDRFIAEHRDRIRGDVLEVGDDRCATTFGRDVRRVEIVDLATDNLRATLVADLGDAGSLPAAAYDCAVIVLTLQFVAEVETALANLWQSLRPGGHLLVTVPSLGRCDPYAPGTESWRFLEPGLRHAAERAFDPPPSTLTLAGFGNLRAAIAAIAGIAADELTADELDATSGEYPVVVALAATKPTAAATRSPHPAERPAASTED